MPIKIPKSSRDNITSEFRKRSEFPGLPVSEKTFIQSLVFTSSQGLAHKIKIFQGWMRPGGVLEFGVVGKAEGPNRGYDCQRLQPTIKTCIKGTQTVIQSHEALKQLLARPSTNDPPSAPPSPVGN
ncbi:hypothetical protein BGX26_006461 [Mortierella sp. AD094]|nr:hypothetical protein BGX26_006461 [Mortierella sp. AD094]